MTWQLLIGFLVGFFSWPLGAVMVDVFAAFQARITIRAAHKIREAQRVQYEKEKALGMHSMTVDEWESYYGPLPTDREMLG